MLPNELRMDHDTKAGMEMEVLDKCNLCGNEMIEELDAACCICGCRACGYIFDSPRPTLGEIEKYYSRPDQYNDWLANEGPRDDLWQRRLRRMSGMSKSGNLLDVGTGIGQFLYYAKNLFSEVYGTELSSSAIEIAREKYGLEITNGDLLDLDFSNPSNFDNITMFHILEHVPDPRRAIEKCHTLLSQGGILVIAVPNDIYSLKAKLKILLKRLGSGKFKTVGKLGLPRIVLDGSLSEIHLSHFRPKTLAGLLENSGFEVIENSLDPYFVASGKKLLLHRLHYLSCSCVRALTGINIYDTIWMIAKKR